MIEGCHYPYIRKDVSSAKTLPVDTFDTDRSLTTQLFPFKNYLHLISCVSSISHVIFNSVAYPCKHETQKCPRSDAIRSKIACRRS